VINFRTALAAVFWLALLLQLWITVEDAQRTGAPLLRALTDYFLYFTTLTIAFCGMVLTVWAFPRWDGRVIRFFRRHGTTTGATVSLILVGLIHHFMLRPLATAEGLARLSEIALHYVVPILFTGFWWEYVPRGALAMRDIPRWMIFPASYAVYAFVRGIVLHHYQYPFVDVTALGLSTAVRNAGLTVLVFVAVAIMLVLVNRFAGNPTRLEY
jgi:hypothetical protein